MPHWGSETEFELAIVCDMWLTGTDIPCLHTLYLDKPMKGHTIIQAISRVNRVFRDKPHGLIVDYIGIADELREATGKYSQGGGRGEPVPSVSEEAKPLFLEGLAAVREMLPEGRDYGAWRRLSPATLEDRYALVFGHLTETDERRDAFLHAELRLSQAYLLVKHLDECRAYADEVIFYQRVRKELGKTLPGANQGEAVYGVDFMRDLIHEVVQVIKRTVKVDWTEPHRDDVKAAVRAAVRRVLRSRDVRAEDFEPFVTAVMAQAEALFANWPVAA